MLNTLKKILQENSSEGNTNSHRLAPTDAIDILSSERRRQVISYIHNHDRETSIRELSEFLVEVEENSDRKTVYISLYQQHLSKLDATGVVCWDKRGGVVKQGPHSDVVYRILRQIEQELDQ